ncbi:alpha/beta hydrolase fold domain-containing protein [Humibacter sp. RRB41]|uniref:alpha/beta hydrolase fold domain-containing protein n=1 Tax=Humibacter sp. RRB41 TaxID=2919946 RepID=UPI001FAA54B4|nr:alpha/beta hydrolase fold domain-containing protein [Humibacter sp. RRB41]
MTTERTTADDTNTEPYVQSESHARLLGIRAALDEVMGSRPVPDGVRRSTSRLAGVPVLDITIEGVEPRGTLLWFHGGGFVAGTPDVTIGKAAATARATKMRVRSVEYRLAPEHPFPAAPNDALAAYRAVLEEVPADELIIGGESAGAGLALGLALAARDAGLPLPRGVVLYSPPTDLAMTGASHRTKVDVDDALTPALLSEVFGAYADGVPLDDPRVSPLHADLRGLPPLLVVAGTHELLLDDALALVARAAAADVDVDLVVGAGMPHVFPGRSGLARASEALDVVGAFAQRRLGLPVNPIVRDRR